MSKIRIKTLGDEELEQKEKKKAKQKKEAKKLGNAPVEPSPVIASDQVRLGQRGNLEIAEPVPSEIASGSSSLRNDERGISIPRNDKSDKKKKAKKSKARKRSECYQAAKSQVDRTKKYPISEALELLPKVHLAKFDETVELHINTTETLSGTVCFPHGTGKKVRVAIATDDILKEIEQGNINFDILLAEPSMMPKLARVARILGPKGLMPNPKNGTISVSPEKTALQFADGLITFKTEAKASILHLTIGKLSFGDKKLAENIKTAFDAVKKERIKQAVLKSTMSPGIKLEVN